MYICTVVLTFHPAFVSWTLYDSTAIGSPDYSAYSSSGISVFKVQFLEIPKIVFKTISTDSGFSDKEYINSNTIAAKVLGEGDKCECEILLLEECGCLYKCEEYLAELELRNFDFSSSWTRLFVSVKSNALC